MSVLLTLAFIAAGYLLVVRPFLNWVERKGGNLAFWSLSAGYFLASTLDEFGDGAWGWGLFFGAIAALSLHRFKREAAKARHPSFGA